MSAVAKRAKAANLDAIHDTVHEMARDEASPALSAQKMLLGTKKDDGFQLSFIIFFVILDNIRNCAIQNTAEPVYCVQIHKFVFSEPMQSRP